MKKNIAIVMGGYSSEVEISLKSGNIVYSSLDTKKYNLYCVHILKNKWVLVDNNQEYPINKADFSTEIDGKKIIFDCVFNAIHGTPGEDGKLIAYFELIGIPHTSAPSYQMALTFNKRDTLSVVKPYGIKTAVSFFLNEGDTIDEETILNTVGLPCFVKANRAGSSFGITKVYKKKELQHALQVAFKEDNEVIIESFLDGTEVSVGVISFKGQTKVLPITEIVSDNDFFDYKAKYLGESEEITPARLDKKTEEKVIEVARKVYDILRMKGFSRSEYIIVNGEPHLLEMNTVPGLTNESILPQQALHAGISLNELFDNAIEEALQ
ncbi:MAG TPA: D-alanine--D-alanine ligase [Flavobacteriaceae bacterium]|nr:D-alanine--D-alanine ligase [Flavobacteriaceae bacterium]